MAQRDVAVQGGVVAKAIPRGQRLAELDGRAFEGHDRVSGVAHAAHHVCGQQLVVHLQRAEEDVAVRVDLGGGTQTQRYWGVLGATLNGFLGKNTVGNYVTYKFLQ